MTPNIKKVMQVRLTDIKPGKYQPRKSIQQAHVVELAESLAEVGLQEPIVIKASRSDPGMFELISGEYRWRAATQLGWETIESCLTDDSDKHIAVGAITANGSLPLNPIELAEAYARLHDEFNMTHADIAKACGKGKNRTHVSKILRMLQLPKMVRELLAEEKLTVTHAQILLEAPSNTVVVLSERCVNFGWDTRRLKEEIAGASDQKLGLSKVKDQRTQDWLELESELSKTVGVPVAIKPKKKRSREAFDIELQCRSRAELEQLLNHLKDFQLSVEAA